MATSIYIKNNGRERERLITIRGSNPWIGIEVRLMGGFAPFGEVPLDKASFFWALCKGMDGNRSNNIFVIYVECVVIAIIGKEWGGESQSRAAFHVFICHAAVSANIKLPLVRLRREACAECVAVGSVRDSKTN